MKNHTNIMLTALFITISVAWFLPDAQTWQVLQVAAWVWLVYTLALIANVVLGRKNK